MGAHVDLPAASAFVVIFLAFLALRHRVSGAIQARDARSNFEKTLQSVEVRTIGGEAEQGELEEAQSKFEALQQREEEARTVSGPFGYTFRLMVPGLPNSNNNNRSARRGALTGTTSSAGDAEEMKKLGPLQYVVLGLVLLSQLWLLAVLSADPMAPPSDMFYSTFGSQ